VDACNDANFKAKSPSIAFNATLPEMPFFVNLRMFLLKLCEKLVQALEEAFFPVKQRQVECIGIRSKSKMYTDCFYDLSI